MLSAEDHVAIERLYAAYNQYIDADRIDDWVTLFAPDGALVIGSFSRAGTEALRKFGLRRVEQRPSLPVRSAQHWINNLLLEHDPQSGVVRGSCYLVRLGIDRETDVAGVMSLGRYEDEIVRHDDEWVFARREVIVL